MKYKDRIEISEEILTGKPVIKGTRIAVEFIIELLANGVTMEDILANYPQLTKEDIFAAREYHLDILKKDKVYV